ncbi:hypothetical protein D3C87_2082030 [compost metagenome]
MGALQIVLDLQAGECHPGIGPGIFVIRPVEGEQAGKYQEALTGAQIVGASARAHDPFAAVNVMDLIVFTHKWTNRMPG